MHFIRDDNKCVKVDIQMFEKSGVIVLTFETCICYSSFSEFTKPINKYSSKLEIWTTQNLMILKKSK